MTLFAYNFFSLQDLNHIPEHSKLKLHKTKIAYFQLRQLFAVRNFW